MKQHISWKRTVRQKKITNVLADLNEALDLKENLRERKARTGDVIAKVKVSLE